MKLKSMFPQTHQETKRMMEILHPIQNEKHEHKTLMDSKNAEMISRLYSQMVALKELS
jgi:hypothetical protein